MSRTRRRDPVDVERKRPDIVILGTAIQTTPTPEDRRKAHMDGKKTHKPGRAAKVALHKGRKAKVRRALGKVVEDPEASPMPREPKSDLWRYN